MTNTPSPDDAAKTIFASMQWAARHAEKGTPPDWVERGNSLAQAEARGAARSIVESLLSDRAKLEEALADNAELRSERDALLQKPIDFAKLDSIDEDAIGKMVAYYWWQQAQDARAALKDERA